MIKDYLSKKFELGKFYSSWLINADNTLNALAEVKNFIQDILLNTNLPLENHPDFMLIEKSTISSGSKNITIDQIRSLQVFMNKTSAISGKKAAIIYQAELMNLYAANSCLKILEDTPRNSYIFLISSKAASLLPTIRSRCEKYNLISVNKFEDDDLYKKILKLLNKGNIEEKLKFLHELAQKDKELYIIFSNKLLYLFNKIIKKAIGLNIELTPEEHEVISEFSSTSPQFLINKFEKIQNIIDNTINYDLELRSSYLLLCNVFQNSDHLNLFK